MTEINDEKSISQVQNLKGAGDFRFVSYYSSILEYMKAISIKKNLSLILKSLKGQNSQKRFFDNKPAHFIGFDKRIDTAK